MGKAMSGKAEVKPIKGRLQGDKVDRGAEARHHLSTFVEVYPPELEMLQKKTRESMRFPRFFPYPLLQFTILRQS